MAEPFDNGLMGQQWTYTVSTTYSSWPVWVGSTGSGQWISALYGLADAGPDLSPEVQVGPPPPGGGNGRI